MTGFPEKEQVDSYRDHLLTVWDIGPTALTDELAHRLSSTDYQDLVNWKKTVATDNHPSTLDRFYRWLMSASRFGSVQSSRWMEILTSGIWASVMLKELNVCGPVLDIGCNAGYWNSWMSYHNQRAITGMDKREIVIHFGQKRQNEFGLRNPLLVADFMDAYPSHKYAAIVSLQGLTEAFHCQQKRIFESVAIYLMKDGYLIMIDELPGQSLHYEKMWKQAGFHLCAAGMVGGLGIDHEWKSYLALVLKLGGADTTKTIVEAEKATEQLWQSFHLYGTDSTIDWTLRNSAYWWAAHEDAFVFL